MMRLVAVAGNSCLTIRSLIVLLIIIIIGLLYGARLSDIFNKVE